MFSPRIYWRLFESLNEAWWPVQPLLIGAGLAWLRWEWQAGGERRSVAWRGAAGFLALCWIVVAWTFHQQRFAPVNWVASSYAVAFVLQSIGLAALAVAGGLARETHTARRRTGVALGLWALLGHPLLSLLLGRPWQQAEVFGLAPDPTVIATLAFLLMARAETTVARRLLATLWTVPLLWVAVSAATLATMRSLQALVPLAAAILALASLARH
jgi:hypothetical protein